MTDIRIVGNGVRERDETNEDRHFRFANVHARLVTSTPHFEVIDHHLEAGAYWCLRPNETLGVTECCSVEDGQLEMYVNQEHHHLKTGDVVTLEDLSDFVVFYAKSPAHIVYIANDAFYDVYRKLFHQLHCLSVDIEQKDGYTSQHCYRIMNLSLLVGRKLGLAPEDLFHLQIGAFLHDVGKVKVPETILGKPGPLTPGEWELMKRHTVQGRDLLCAVDETYFHKSSVIVEQHHERYDGSGYPYGISGSEIHLGAAIVAVVDSYDAMTTDRIYRKAVSPEAALRELRELSGTLYNPTVVEAFLKVMEDTRVPL